jgi:hypothetical protein
MPVSKKNLIGFNVIQYNYRASLEKLFDFQTNMKNIFALTSIEKIREIVFSTIFSFWFPAYMKMDKGLI